MAEHATTTLQQSFLFHTVFMIFAGIGAWLVIRALARYREDRVYVRPDMLAFALMIGMTGVYISSSYVRLEVFAAVSVIIMASLGLGMLSREFLGRGGGGGMHGIDYDAAGFHASHNGRMRADGGDNSDGPSDDTAGQQGDAARTRTSSSPKPMSTRAQHRAMRMPPPQRPRQRPPRRQASRLRRPEHAVRGWNNGATAPAPSILWKRRVRHLYNYRHAADHTDWRRVVRDAHRRPGPTHWRG